MLVGIWKQADFPTLPVTTEPVDHSGIHSVVGDSSGSQCVTRLIVCLLCGLAFAQVAVGVALKDCVGAHLLTNPSPSMTAVRFVYPFGPMLWMVTRRGVSRYLEAAATASFSVLPTPSVSVLDESRTRKGGTGFTWMPPQRLARSPPTMPDWTKRFPPATSGSYATAGLPSHGIPPTCSQGSVEWTHSTP